MAQDTQTVSTRSKIVWTTLSLMIAALFMYASVQSAGSGEAFAAEAGEGMSASYSAEASM